MNLRERIISVIHKVATSSKGIRIPLTPIGAIFFLLLTALFVALSLKVDKMMGFSKFMVEP